MKLHNEAVWGPSMTNFVDITRLHHMTQKLLQGMASEKLPEPA